MNEYMTTLLEYLEEKHDARKVEVKEIPEFGLTKISCDLYDDELDFGGSYLFILCDKELTFTINVINTLVCMKKDDEKVEKLLEHYNKTNDIYLLKDEVGAIEAQKTCSYSDIGKDVQKSLEKIVSSFLKTLKQCMDELRSKCDWSPEPDPSNFSWEDDWIDRMITLEKILDRFEKKKKDEREVENRKE